MLSMLRVKSQYVSMFSIVFPFSIGEIPLFDHDLVGEESPWTPSSLAGQYHRQEVPEPEKKWHEKNGGFTTTHRTVQQQEEIEVD